MITIRAACTCPSLHRRRACRQANGSKGCYAVQRTGMDLSLCSAGSVTAKQALMHVSAGSCLC